MIICEINVYLNTNIQQISFIQWLRYFMLIIKSNHNTATLLTLSLSTCSSVSTSAANSECMNDGVGSRSRRKLSKHLSSARRSFWSIIESVVDDYGLRSALACFCTLLSVVKLSSCLVQNK